MKLNGHEKIAATNIKHAFNWEFGGVFNEWQDGYFDEEPCTLTLQDMKDQVYEGAMNNLYREGYCGYGKSPKEMRFAGEEFCRKYIDKLFAEDEDVNLVPWATDEEEEETEMKNTREEARAYIIRNYTVKEMREHLKEAGVKGISKAKKEELVEMMLDIEEQKNESDDTTPVKRVKMFAFTGMLIGEFDCEVTDEYILVYTQSRGELQFDKKTGKEITDEKKARYANRVERA